MAAICSSGNGSAAWLACMACTITAAAASTVFTTAATCTATTCPPSACRARASAAAAGSGSAHAHPATECPAAPTPTTGRAPTDCNTAAWNATTGAEPITAPATDVRACVSHLRPNGAAAVAAAQRPTTRPYAWASRRRSLVPAASCASKCAA